jgi:DNA-binding CsgD family transcriptional regulator
MWEGVHVEWRLTGRNAELERLANTVEDGNARGTVLVGDAGVGKSRLLRAVIDRAQTAGFAVERVYGSVAASRIPFGAVSDLLPDKVAGERLGLLRQLRGSLERRADGRRMLLAVDDAHHLDPGSLSFVHQIATTDSALVVATARSDESIPESLTALWKDGHVDRFDVEPLDRARTRVLLHEVLGGDIGDSLAESLFRVTLGYPLYLRVLVETSIEAGRLRREEGAWRFDGLPFGSARLNELVTHQIRGLDAAERAAFELVAVAEPLPEQVAASVADRAVVERLLTRGLCRRDVAADGVLVRTLHPLHAQMVVQHLDATTRAACAADLARAWSAEAGPNAQLEAARWALEGGVDIDPGSAGVAAREALGRFDHDLAARLARAALDVLPDDPVANIVMAETLRHRRQGDAVVHHLTRAAAHAVDDLMRAKIAVIHAETEFLLRKDQAEAIRVLDEAARAVHDDEAAHVLAVETAFLGAVAGRLSRVVDVAEKALEADISEETELEVANVIVFSQALSLRLDGVDERCERGLELAARFHNERPLAEHQIGLSQALARIGQCRPRQAVALARQGLERTRGGGAPTGIWGTVVAFAGCFTGDLDAAADAGVEAVTSLLEDDPFGTIGMAAMIGSVAAHQAGRGDDADWLCERQGPPTWGADPRARAALEGREQAWRAAAAGDVEKGAEIAARVGAQSLEDGQNLWSAAALHDAVRLGHPELALGDLHALLDDCGNALVAAALYHAEALHARDANALARVAASWADGGFTLFAVDAEAQLARIAAAGGDEVEACRSATRAWLRWRRCTGVPTVALEAAPPPLSDRELEIACHAASGETSREIGEQLYLSIRTVDNHLRNAYRHLGVSGRDELRIVLRDALTPPD